MSALSPLLAAMPDPAPAGVSLRRATVTAVGPLRIQFDGESAPVASTPATIVPVGPGDRVLVAHHGRTQATILGVIGTSGVPWRVAAGTTTITGTGETTAGAETDLPGRFTRTPIVTVTAHTSVYIAYRGGGTSSSRVSVGVRRYDGGVIATGTSILVDWTATQMSPTSAGG